MSHDSPLRLLVLAAVPPLPATDGGRIATIEPLRRLVRRGHHVDLLTFRTGEADVTALRSALSDVMFVDDHPERRRWRTRLLSPARARPYMASVYSSRRFARTLAHLLATRQYDLVQVETLSMSSYVPLLKNHGLPIVLRTQNVESALCAGEAAVATGLRRRHYRLQAPKLAAWEGRTLRDVDLTVALTRRDALALGQLSGQLANITVVPAGVDLLGGPCAAPGGSPVVLFAASMDFPPNDDAVRWFLEAIWPAIVARVPGATFVAAGRNPSPQLRRRADGRSIVVTGHVEGMSPWFERAWVCVAPIRIGGGMRIKILQALAAGRPVVATPTGAEGIAMQHGREGYVADDPVAFAGYVVRVLSDEARRRAMGTAARQLAERTCGWEPAVVRLEQHYRDLVHGPAGNLRAAERTA